jgi:hypothetical protein
MTMRAVTRKHLLVVRGLPKFAQVTVGRGEQSDGSPVAAPQIVLNDRPLPRLADGDREIIEAARQGIRETEALLAWQGPRHFVVAIEGLEVDGIDANAARLAAGLATRELIEQ